MTARLEITAEQIQKLVLNQFEAQKSTIEQLSAQEKSNTPLRLTFDNLLFPDKYAYYDRNFYNLRDFLQHLINDLKIINVTNEIVLVFKECLLPHIEANPFSNFLTSFIFAKCRITLLAIVIVNLNHSIHITDSKIITCKFTHKEFYGNMVCEESIFESFYTNGTQFNFQIRFKGCSFGGGTESKENVDFSNSVFKSRVSFEGSTFIHAPLFYEATLHADTNWKNCKFLDVSSVHAWGAYRTLKHFMMKNESDHEAQLFHALELESRYNTVLKGHFSQHGMEAICSLVLRKLTNYGKNLLLPLGCLIILMTGFYIYYLSFGGIGCDTTLSLQGWLQGVCAGHTEIFYAIRNAFGPFGLALGDGNAIIPNNLLVRALGFAQLALSSIIWFIWILQIRSRFKI